MSISSNIASDIAGPAATDQDSADSDDPGRSPAEIIETDPRWLGIDGLRSVMTVATATAITRAGRDTDAVALTIALSNDDEVRDLNSQYRGKDQPTNVLSFPAGDFPLDPDMQSVREFVGDIILAYDTIEQEAVADGKPFAHHAVHLAVHGVLHLLGYDHEYDESAEEMERIEIEVLASLGIPNPYAENDADNFAGAAART